MSVSFKEHRTQRVPAFEKGNSSLSSFSLFQGLKKSERYQNSQLPLVDASRPADGPR